MAGGGREGREGVVGKHLAIQGPTLEVGGLAQASSAALQSRDSKKGLVAFYPCLSVSQNDPSPGQLQEEQWQNWSCAQPSVPRT